MIQKARVYPQFQYAPEKYQLDHFHNPYLVKLSIKITPRLQHKQSLFQLVSPISSSNNLYLSHSIPILKNQKLRVALVWRQRLANKFARVNVGASIEHKIYQNYKIKGLVLTGTNSLLNLQFSKRFASGYQTSVGYSGFVENSKIYNSFSLGLRKNLYSFVLTHKLSSQSQFKLGVNRQITDSVNLAANVNGNPLQPERSEVEVRLSHQVSKKDETSLSLTCNPYYKELSLKVEYERSIAKYHKLLLCSEYSQNSSIIYLGYKNLNFNIAFPVLVIDSMIPIALSLVGFGLSYFLRKYKAKQQSNFVALGEDQEGSKKESQRQEELKIISEKAADNYEKERNQVSGLLIEEAYIGPSGEVQPFMDNPERLHLLLRNQEYKQKFVDLTVSLRFYVSRSELKLRKGDKSKMLGFYRKSNNCDCIGIRYSRRGVTKVQYFNYNDPIVIKRE